MRLSTHLFATCITPTQHRRAAPISASELGELSSFTADMACFTSNLTQTDQKSATRAQKKFLWGNQSHFQNTLARIGTSEPQMLFNYTVNSKFSKMPQPKPMPTKNSGPNTLRTCPERVPDVCPEGPEHVPNVPRTCPEHPLNTHFQQHFKNFAEP